ncbi:MAG: TIGR04157 family glycosyltransferase [Bacteroidales bacterium]|jgi:glycosyltransferase|nr:TIGR04157 family glycosyltransferase [Bacteroidales bacterium]
MNKINFSLSERIANKLVINSFLTPSAGLMNGKTGDAIYLYKLSRLTGNKMYEEVANNLIDLIYEEIHSGTLLNFSSGLAGVGCGIEYLVRENFVDADIDEVLEEIDEAIFQLDRRKYKPSENCFDFYGPGLYYLTRTKNGKKSWNENAVKFLSYDLNSIISETVSEEYTSEKETEISNSFLISLTGFISETKHLFTQKLVEGIYTFVKERVKPETLNITEKIVLHNFIGITDNKPNVSEEIEKLNDVELLKACSDFTCYNMFFPETVAELKLLLQNRLDSVIETESMQKQLFESDSRLAGLYPFISQTGFAKNAEQLSRQIPIKNPDSIKLYIFNETSRAAVYGIGTYINELVQCLKDENININVIKLNDTDIDEFCMEDKEGVKYWIIPASKYRNSDYEKQQRLYYQSVVNLLKQYVTDTDRMYVQLNYMQNMSLLENLKSAFNCKVSVAIHYMSWGFALHGNLTRLKAILTKNETELDNFEKSVRKSFEDEQAFLNKADAIICLANYTCNVLCKEYGIAAHKITGIYNGLHDVAPKLTIKARNDIKRKYHIETGEKIILFAGRLDPIKGLDILINAFKKVLEQSPKARLIVAGDGNFGKYLKTGEYVTTKITFMGHLDKDKLFELYSIADIGVMPSFHEQCSYTAIEMMMHGLPLIASSTTGLAEMLEDGVSGLIIPAIEFEDKVEIPVDLLCEHILYLLNNPKQLKKMGKQIRKRYLEYYDSAVMKRMVMKFLGIETY